MIDINVARLNEYYENIPISFYFDGTSIIINEEISFFLSSNPALKETLKYKYNMTFGNGKKWYISKEGMDRLSRQLLKLQTTLSIDHLKRKLYFYINSISNIPLQQAIKNIFAEIPEFLTNPASMRRHHSYKHGLIEHSIQVVEYALAAWKISEQKKLIDRDVLIAGGLLHDIGKSHVYEINGTVNTPSSIMLEQDHLLHGAILVERYLKAEDLSDELKDKILHIIASHHTLKEWGSPVSPKTLEAWIITSCDNLSAKIGG